MIGGGAVKKGKLCGSNCLFSPALHFIFSLPLVHEAPDWHRKSRAEAFPHLLVPVEWYTAHTSDLQSKYCHLITSA